ncbi:hypothetical protein QTP70_004623 [Hemibagrus guttatus]|uniref:Uncharacterized protein n=1 Tax=Hemibagrus guttatus TaxID=175788 RepID=A0AAE0Q2D3_9TELE|nr:hypothetical protein QTP70_004623 [Hemibagrus guttatus]
MEELMVKYIAKHGSQGMFDGMENIVDKPYEWAIAKFESYPKMPKNKKGKIANALQAVLASYKVTRKTLDALKSESEQLQSKLDDGLICKRNFQATETIWKEEKAEVEETLKRIQSQKGVQGIIIVNSEGMFTLIALVISSTFSRCLVAH